MECLSGCGSGFTFGEKNSSVSTQPGYGNASESASRPIARNAHSNHFHLSRDGGGIEREYRGISRFCTLGCNAKTQRATELNALGIAATHLLDSDPHAIDRTGLRATLIKRLVDVVLERSWSQWNESAITSVDFPVDRQQFSLDVDHLCERHCRCRDVYRHGIAIVAADKDPQVTKALSYKPRQINVNYDQVAEKDIEKCTSQYENKNGAEGLTIYGPEGQVLRRFADVNKDRQVDMWCYFKDGIEVYRDIDSDFNSTAANIVGWVSVAPVGESTKTKMEKLTPGSLFPLRK